MDNCIIINNQRIDLTQEQIAQIASAHSTACIRLSDISAGETFKIGTFEFVVLEQLPESTAVILKDLLPDNVDFGDTNNYIGSNPDQMCSDVAEELFVQIGSENVIPRTVDLTSDDGLKDYGVAENRAVSLITTEEYRRYVEVLDKFKPDRWWWLATPHSTATHDNDNWVKCASPSGDICNFYYDFCSGGIGVRPFCILKSDIFVSR